MARVQDYYPASFFQDQQLILEWLLSRQQAQNSNWEAGVLQTGFPSTTEPGAPYTPTTPALAEADIIDLVATTPLSSEYFTLATFENILLVPPPGQALDNQGGPDGFPVNYSPSSIGGLNAFFPCFPLTSGQITAAYNFNVQQFDPYNRGVQMCTPSGLQTLHPQQGMDIYGYALNMLPGTTYRVDVFVLASNGTYYYQSSATWQGTFQTGGQCQGVQPQPSCFQSYLIPGGYWGAQVTTAGLVVAALYPSSVAQPSSGWSGSALPAGWRCHSNTGIGQKLSNYFARFYSYTGTEALQEDNVPIVVQDFYHARAGSSVVPAAGMITIHVLYNDPVLGQPVLVYTSLAPESAYADLPLSYLVPTSDPAYVPDPTASSAPAMQNRSRLYDCALGIIAFTASGNFRAAAQIISELNGILDSPIGTPTTILENGSNSSSRWTLGNQNDTITDVSDPTCPPNGGNVMDFHVVSIGDAATYAGSGLPDSTDTQIQWLQKPAAGAQFAIHIGVSTAQSKVTQVQVVSSSRTLNGRFPPTLPPTWLNGTTIIISVDAGNGSWQQITVPLAALITQLAGDALTSISSFVYIAESTGDFYLNTLAVSSPQPANSLFDSYDTYHGQPDQQIIRASSMGWLCYAYALYMSQSQDYSPALALQQMINFLLTLQSAAAGLTNELFYQGFGSYPSPGYQLAPGPVLEVYTRDQAILYFAFTRASNALHTASVQLLKTAAITQTQSQSLQATSQQLPTIVTAIASGVLTNLYIPASGSVPGYFAQGATASGLDTSQNMDAQIWGALLANAAGNSNIALQCLQFLQETFYLANQTISETNSSNAWNEVYAESAPFNGYKPFNDSAGGYSGSPAAVSQESTWGMILALLQLYTTPGLSAAIGMSPDTLLATLIVSQRTVWLAPLASPVPGDNGSTLCYSAASRAMPWQFFVWPGFGATAWFWLVSNAPGMLMTVANQITTLSNMTIPAGMSQNVSEVEGASSLSGMTIECNDPTGLLKQLAAQNTLVGQVVSFQMGFPPLNWGDFVAIHTGQITSVGYSSAGKIQIKIADVQRFVHGKQIWKLGGPFAWAPGELSVQPIGEACGFNAFPISDKNPRWVQGNPIRIALAVLQNELGVGQDPALLSSTYILNQLADVYSSEQIYLPQPPPPGWQLYSTVQQGLGQAFNDSTLINPNPYIDVNQWLSLANSTFAGDHFEFKITRSAEGKGWVEEQIFKPLGVYVICGSDGKLRLKTMRPQPWQQVVFQFNQYNILGIPQEERQPVINVVTVKTDVDVQGDSRSGLTLASRAYQNQTTLLQPTSIAMYLQEYAHQIESTGLRVNYGGMLRATLIADRIFRRHAFAPPAYRFTAFLASAQVELGDLVSLSHPKALDMQGGVLSLVNVPCEVLEKKPNWAQGNIEYLVLDRRFLNVATPYQIYANALGPLTYATATPAQQAQYMFISGADNPSVPPYTIF